MRFSYFPGCTVHSTSMEYGKSTDAVFEDPGCRVGRDQRLELLWGGGDTQHQSSPLPLPAGTEILRLPSRPSAGPLVIPCAGCFNMLKRAEHALKTDEAKRKEIEEIVGFTYDTSFELMAVMDVIVNRIGLDKVREKVKKPLSGIKGGLLLRMRVGSTPQSDPAGQS